MIVGALFEYAGALVLAAQAAGPPPVHYAIYPVRSNIADDHVVGPLKKGVACIKAGSLHWSAFALRGDRAAADVVSALAENRVTAVAVDPVLGDADAAAKVSVEILALDADTCQPRYGMLKLGSTGLKGQGSMTIRWRVGGGTGGVTIDETTRADFSFSTRNTSLGAILTAGLAANSRQIATHLRR